MAIRRLWPAAVGVALAAYHVRAWRSDRPRAERLALEAPSGRPALTARPRISVLVAAWDERPHLEGHVASVFALAYPDVEYVLCAGGPDGSYETAGQALRGRGVLLRQEPGEGKQAALRRCLAHATGEIVYLTDADCLLDDASFERTLEPIVEGRAGAATGRSRPPADQIAREPAVLCRWAPSYYAESTLGETSHGLLGRNCAVGRDVVVQAGGFSEAVSTGTDYHLARQLAKLGVPIAFARGSFVTTEMPSRVADYVRQQSRWLRNHWLHGARTGHRLTQLHALQTWAIGLLMVGLPPLRPVLGARCWWLWLLLVSHGWLARLRYVGFLTTAERLPFTGQLLPLSAAWVLIDAFAWARSLFDFLDARRRAIW